MFETDCCKKSKCTRQFTPGQVREFREPFWSFSETGRRNFLLNAFALNMFHDGDKRKYTFNINGKPVCQNGWYMALGISRRWYVYM